MMKFTDEIETEDTHPGGDAGADHALEWGDHAAGRKDRHEAANRDGHNARNEDSEEVAQDVNRGIRASIGDGVSDDDDNTATPEDRGRIRKRRAPDGSQQAEESKEARRVSKRWKGDNVAASEQQVSKSVAHGCDKSNEAHLAGER